MRQGFGMSSAEIHKFGVRGYRKRLTGETKKSGVHKVLMLNLRAIVAGAL
jgi:hypothetical protein